MGLMEKGFAFLRDENPPWMADFHPLDTTAHFWAWLSMLSSPALASSALPDEYRKTAEGLFPPVGGTGGLEEALAFAGILGVRADFRALLDFAAGPAPAEAMRKYLHSFQTNLDLLIQKTWVEKPDEERKEELQNRIPGLIALIEKAAWTEALGEFSEVVDELSWLLFGSQSHKDDFIEYVLRIDTQIGLFWWYGGQIGRACEALKDESLVRGLLLLGLCYLTDF